MAISPEQARGIMLLAFIAIAAAIAYFPDNEVHP
jgi:hypothetical protein